MSDEAQFLQAQEQRLWRLLLGVSVFCEFLMLFPLALYYVGDGLAGMSPSDAYGYALDRDRGEAFLLIFSALLANSAISLLFSFPAKTILLTKAIIFSPCIIIYALSYILALYYPFLP